MAVASPRVIFWDVDTQYDFMKADGKLYVPDAEQLIPNLKKLTDYAHGMVSVSWPAPTITCPSTPRSPPTPIGRRPSRLIACTGRRASGRFPRPPCEIPS